MDNCNTMTKKKSTNRRNKLSNPIQNSSDNHSSSNHSSKKEDFISSMISIINSNKFHYEMPHNTNTNVLKDYWKNCNLSDKECSECKDRFMLYEIELPKGKKGIHITNNKHGDDISTYLESKKAATLIGLVFRNVPEHDFVLPVVINLKIWYFEQGSPNNPSFKWRCDLNYTIPLTQNHVSHCYFNFSLDDSLSQVAQIFNYGICYNCKSRICLTEKLSYKENGIEHVIVNPYFNSKQNIICTPNCIYSKNPKYQNN